MSKQKIKVPLASLNGYDESKLQEVFSLELEASSQNMNKAQKQVIEAYSGYQAMSESKNGVMGRGLSMIEKMVLKNIKATSQSFLYHTVTEDFNPFQGTKVGDIVTVPSIFTASASPIFAQHMSEANSTVIVIDQAKATPLPEEDPGNPTWSYVFASGSKFKVTKFERRTWVHASKISKNVTLVTVEMV